MDSEDAAIGIMSLQDGTAHVVPLGALLTMQDDWVQAVYGAMEGGHPASASMIDVDDIGRALRLAPHTAPVVAAAVHDASMLSRHTLLRFPMSWIFDLVDAAVEDIEEDSAREAGMAVIDAVDTFVRALPHPAAVFRGVCYMDNIITTGDGDDDDADAGTWEDDLATELERVQHMPRSWAMVGVDAVYLAPPQALTADGTLPEQKVDKAFKQQQFDSWRAHGASVRWLAVAESIVQYALWCGHVTVSCVPM